MCMLITVCDKDISTEKYSTFESAQEAMLDEISLYCNVYKPYIGMLESDVGIQYDNAWVDSRNKWVWQIEYC